MIATSPGSIRSRGITAVPCEKDRLAHASRLLFCEMVNAPKDGIEKM